jgi:uncharacterized protein (DUF1800 family)
VAREFRTAELLPPRRHSDLPEIDHLARHEGTARFIALMLCRYLINDAPPPEPVGRVAGVFLQTGGDLPAVYRAVVFSPEFVRPGIDRAKFKAPFGFTVGALRATDARIDSPRQVFRRLGLMGSRSTSTSSRSGTPTSGRRGWTPG